MPVLKQQLKGYQFCRNNKPDKRVAISIWNGKLIKLLNSISSTSYIGRLQRLTFLLQHKALLRTAETGLSGNSEIAWERALRVSNFIWYPCFKHATDVVVTKTTSKTNRLGKYKQEIPVCCECPAPCLVHTLKDWLCSLATANKGILKANSFVLIYENGRLISDANIRKWMKEQCKVLKWKTEQHKPYSLRIGRAEDLFHIGVPNITIRDLGCWRTDSYMRYIRPTAQDNLFLLKKKQKKCVVQQLYRQHIKFNDLRKTSK